MSSFNSLVVVEVVGVIEGSCLRCCKTKTNLIPYKKKITIYIEFKSSDFFFLVDINIGLFFMVIMFESLKINTNQMKNEERRANEE